MVNITVLVGYKRSTKSPDKDEILKCDLPVLLNTCRWITDVQLTKDFQ